jgi:hypothetical protein
MFLLSVLEAGTVPRGLRRAAQAVALLCFVTGFPRPTNGSSTPRSAIGC